MPDGWEIEHRGLEIYTQVVTLDTRSGGTPQMQIWMLTGMAWIPANTNGAFT